MQTVEYALRDITPGTVIVHQFGDTRTQYTVRRIIDRPGHAIQFYTEYPCGKMGPHINPHPSRPVEVIGQPAPVADTWVLSGSDYPHAERL